MKLFETCFYQWISFSSRCGAGRSVFFILWHSKSKAIAGQDRTTLQKVSTFERGIPRTRGRKCAPEEIYSILWGCANETVEIRDLWKWTPAGPVWYPRKWFPSKDVCTVWMWQWVKTFSLWVYVRAIVTDWEGLWRRRHVIGKEILSDVCMCVCVAVESVIKFCFACCSFEFL